MPPADVKTSDAPLGGRRLHILQVAAMPFPTPQGSQVYVRGMARALARRGHKVTVVCYAHGQGEPDPEYAVVRAPSIPGYRRLRSGPDLVKPLLDAALAARLSQLDADIVHAHNYEAPLVAAIAGLRRRLPVVYSAHTLLQEELPTYFSARPAQRAAGGLGWLLDRTVPRLSAHAIAISERNADFLRSIGCRRVSHVPPGVEASDLVMPSDCHRLSGGPWVVYAGNPDRYQDLDVLIAAMRQLPEAGLLLVSASRLDHLAGAGLRRLRCVQTSDFSEVRRWLASADVAALPRSVCSGYPIKLLNYLGMGLPTVAAQGSARPLPGVVAVADRDPAAMAAAIRSLLQDRPRRQALGAAAREHVLTACTWEQRVIGVEAVYAEVLGIGRRRGILRHAETDFG
ncbi:MAG: glycosyltransferase involved in cell wall biosynthesis [Myxococcota bacterium]|jgi:glycosyltransferase involved in cell wall biosynthesis